MIEQVKALSDRGLDELMAKAQGWKKKSNHKGRMYWVNKKGEFHITLKGYSPTSNTTEGKAQCFDLMVKFGIELEFSKQGRCWIETAHQESINREPKTEDNMWDGVQITGDKPKTQRLICEAIALSHV